MIRKFGIKTCLVLLFTVVLCACEQQSPGNAEPSPPPLEEHSDPASAVEVADLVLRGGKIATVDPDIGDAQAIAILGHNILAVGSNDEITAHIGPDTEVIELDGRFAMPGFIEGHGHYMGAGEARQMLDLNGVRNWGEVVSMVSDAVEQSEPGEWILGRGWHQEKWDSIPENAIDGVPVNDSLNAVAPDNPVLLGHASGHAAFANDAALSRAGITDDTDDPAGGTIVRTHEGRATGLLRETARGLVDSTLASHLSDRSVGEIDQELRERALLAGQDALRHGITSFQDAGSSFETISFLKTLEDEGALPVRLYVMIGGESAGELEALLPTYKMLAEENDFLVVRSIKRVIDGALGAHGAWLLKPYEDMPATSGLVLQPVEEIERAAELAALHGFQVNTHAIGDRGNRETLDIYERVFNRSGVDGKSMRWRIEHAQHIDPADVPRFADLGVLASMQGVHASSDGPWLAPRLGKERADQISYVWKDLIDAGARINNGTDVPVEAIDPIASFYSSVSRMTRLGSKFTPEQAMTRQQALESYTINNAYAAFEEDVKGSLTPGKLADIVVLSQNIMTVPEEHIAETKVEMTIVGGVIKYQRTEGEAE